MKKYLCCAILVYLLLAVLNVWAAPPSLIGPENISVISRSTNSLVSRQRLAVIGSDVFENALQVNIRLNLFEDVQYEAKLRCARRGVRGFTLWTGELIFDECGKIVLITDDKHVSATVFLANFSYQIRPVGENLHMIREIDNKALGSLKGRDLSLPAEESRLIELVNQERAIEGLRPLQPNEQLRLAANNHARDMAIGNYFSHDRRDGRKFFQRIFDTGYPISKCGENIAAGFISPEEAFEGLIISPQHRANILNSDFTQIGVGYLFSNDSRFHHYWAQSFGGAKVPDAHPVVIATKPLPADFLRSFAAKILGMGKNG